MLFSGQHNGAWSLHGMGDKALMAKYYVEEAHGQNFF